MPIYGQVGLFSLAAFALGVLFTWLTLARPLRRRVDELETEAARRPEPAPASLFAPAEVEAAPSTALEIEPARNYDDPPYRAAVFGSYPDFGSDDALRHEQFTPSHLSPSTENQSIFDEPVRTQDTGQPEQTDQDAAYFAFLEEAKEASTADFAPSEVDAATVDPAGAAPEAVDTDAADPEAEQRGALRLSNSEEPALAREDAPTEVFRPISADLPDEATGVAGTSDLAAAAAEPATPVGGDLSGHLDDAVALPETPVNPAEQQPEADASVAGSAPEEPAIQDSPADDPGAAEQPVAEQPVAELEAPEQAEEDSEPADAQPVAAAPVGAMSGATENAEAPVEDDPAPERPRALFEPALEPTFADEFEETTYMEPVPPAPATVQAGPSSRPEPQPWADPQAEAGRPVPTGPFGPGSALPQPDGSAPSPEFVVKARTSSMVFHTASSPFYDRLLPQVWFRSAEEAMRAGFTSWERPEGSWGAS